LKCSAGHGFFIPSLSFEVTLRIRTIKATFQGENFRLLRNAVTVPERYRREWNSSHFQVSCLVQSDFNSNQGKAVLRREKILKFNSGKEEKDLLLRNVVRVPERYHWEFSLSDSQVLLLLRFDFDSNRGNAV